VSASPLALMTPMLGVFTLGRTPVMLDFFGFAPADEFLEDEQEDNRQIVMLKIANSGRLFITVYF
jgi:hypothetical protein